MQINDRLNQQISKEKGFTLIELSIVLVIIGLIIGGILTGQDLINAATIRAQISQIEKYNTAVRTFQNKYGYLPGDIPNPYATQFGFIARGTNSGEGDGNGILQGSTSATMSNCGLCNGTGELTVFWVDLSAAQLIDTTFTASTETSLYYLTSNYNSLYPTAKISQNSYVFLYSNAGINYFDIMAPSEIYWGSYGGPGMTVQQAYNIDKKADDGLPQSGSIIACYVNWGILTNQLAWASNPTGWGSQGDGGANCTPAALTQQTAYNANNCFDNNNVAGPETYSLTKNANVQNCTLSFRFQ